MTKIIKDKFKSIIEESNKLHNELSTQKKIQYGLEHRLTQIYTAKSYKTWQKYCSLRDKVTNPKLIFSIIKNKLPLGLRYRLKKIYSRFDQNTQEFEKHKKFLINVDKNDQEIKIIPQKVSVIIPTKNAGPFFELALKKIVYQKYLKQLELIVLDSGSSDNTVKIAKRFHAKVIKIEPETFSHSATRNIGAKYATGKYLVFTVQDAFFLNDRTIYDLVSLLKETGSVAGSARQIPRFDADVFASWQIEEFTRCISPHKQNVLVDISPEKFSNLPFENKRSYCPVDDVCSIFLRKKFIELNGFDESYKYGEDLEIGKRIIESGNKIIYLCNNGVVHSHTRLASYFIKTYYLGTILQSRVFSKHKTNQINMDYSQPQLLKALLILGVNLEKKYSSQYAGKYPSFTSLAYISDILKKFKKVSLSNKKFNPQDLQNELDLFMKDRLTAINIFTDVNKLSPANILTLIDKIYAIFVGDKLASVYLNLNSQNPEFDKINKILESGV